MRSARYLLAMGLISTGAVFAYSGETTPLAFRMAQALQAAPAAPTPAPSPEPAAAEAVAAPTVQEETTLPRFVPARHDLTFPADTKSPTPSTPPAQSAALAPAGSDAAPAGSGNGASSGESESKSEDVPGALTSLDANGQPQRIAPDGVANAADGRAIIPAKKLFGKVKGPSLLQARAIGSYSRGCIAGAVALPVDGPAWQAMRLSRNRTWGHPKLINLIEKFATEAQKQDGWKGMLVGDISQPRGGPMLTGHMSHQLGLDADIWLMPMPDRKLSRQERESVSAVSMLDNTELAVDPKVFTDNHVKILKRAASYPEVERVLVHPAIKKALCEAAGTDRAWLGKVRPIQGHHYHFHIRIGCPPGSKGCVAQKAVTGEDGCTAEVDGWLKRMARAKLPAPPKPPGWKPAPPPPPMTLADMPADCKMVLESGADGVALPQEALLKPAKAKPVDKKGQPLVKATITLKPAKERRPAGAKQ
jgi:penicillin-insensitive murein endopeptidase